MFRKREYQIFKSKIFILFLIVGLISPISNGIAQSEDQIVPRLQLILQSEFDSQNSNKRVFQKYFSNDEITDFLTSALSYRLKNKIDENLTDLAITTVNIELQGEGRQINTDFTNSYRVINTVHVDDEVNLYSKLRIIDLNTNTVVLNVPYIKAMKSELADDDSWDTISSIREQTGNLNPKVEKIADSLSQQVSENVTRWIIQSSIKFRVAVEEFKEISSTNESVPEFGEMLRTMVESELSRSEAILLHTDLYSSSTNNGREAKDLKEEYLLNYIIDGKYIKIGNQLRIDVRCIKRPFDRILVAKRAIVESITVADISRVMVDISNQIKRVMESDFTRRKKTIAFVPKTSPTYGDNPFFKNTNSAIVSEISRTLTQKLNLLTASIDTSSTPYLNLQILGFSPELLKYQELSMQPSEIIADLDVDYLVLTRFDDMGEQVRISSSLHSFDSEIPAAALYIHENTVDKTHLNAEIDQTVINLIRHLCNFGFVSSSISCENIEKGGIPMRQVISRVEMPSIIKDKHFGIRFGAVASRADKNLFMGEESGSYFEVYYSRMLPFLSHNSPGGRFNGGIEVGIGIDTGGNYSFSGAAVANSMINAKFILTPWQYSRTATNFILGGGVAFQGIRYNFKPGTGPYLGNESYRDTAFRTTGNVFAEVEFPLWNSLAIDVLIRYIPPTKSINTFRDLPLEGYEAGNGPAGQLGGAYLIAGLKYLFH